MKQINKLYLLFFIALIASMSTFGQSTLKDFGYKGGLQINGLMPTTEFEDDNGLSLSSFLVRGFFRYELSKNFQTEFGLGIGKYSGDGGTYYKPGSKYSSTIIPIDARLLYTPWELENWNPYLYAGLGLLSYNVTEKPLAASVLSVSESGITGSIPFGIGTEIKLSDEVALDVSAGYAFTFTDNLNYYSIKGTNDGYVNIGVGLSLSNESLNTDKDHDGLNRGEELSLGTDPNNADTDGDGLNDGIEVKQYTTDPRKADTDADGLNDGEELLKFKTNPLKADTDGDGLTDSEEVLKFKTDPLNTDTDGDGLKDGDEVIKYKTDPLKTDTDGDGLKDGDEVLKYKTDPLKVDTDGGTIGDGIEVNRGTNPLDASDDVPPAFVEKEYNYKNVHFGFNLHKFTKKEKKSLDSTYTTLSQLTDPKITVAGHADAIGSDNYNMKLSEKRANIVKEYLVKKGLSADKISVEFFGESKPISDNKTAKGRALNRRTEIKAKVMEKAN